VYDVSLTFKPLRYLKWPKLLKNANRNSYVFCSMVPSSTTLKHVSNSNRETKCFSREKLSHVRFWPRWRFALSECCRVISHPESWYSLSHSTMLQGDIGKAAYLSVCPSVLRPSHADIESKQVTAGSLVFTVSIQVLWQQVLCPMGLRWTPLWWLQTTMESIKTTKTEILD